MKKQNLVLTVSILALSALATEGALANHNHRHPRHGGGYDHGYGDGFFAGLAASTAGIFTSHITAGHYKELVMMGADEDAAAFIATQGQPSAILQAAITLERGILADAGVLTELSDEAVAQVIIERATTLK